MTAKKPQETAQPVEQPVNNDCFIIMPIADHPDYKQGHFKRVYEDIFAPACRAAGYKPVRADDTKQANLIQLDILQKLLESPMAICDLSTRNPNVLFELGLRQAFDKPTILVQEEGTPKIFDINIFRYVEYHNGLDYRDVLNDQRAIEEVLKETKKAVEEGKSVNSIIKLLSITNPASLQDTSNFGDKEYFNILVSEIQGIKSELRNQKTLNEMTKNNKNSYLYKDTIQSTPVTFYECEQMINEAQHLFDKIPNESKTTVIEMLDEAESNLRMIMERGLLPVSAHPKAYQLREKILKLKATAILYPDIP